MITSIIAVLFTFGLVIFLHEFGHFLVCKLSGIKVEAFSFGFGPELYGRTSGPTRYSVRAIPLGGYVKPAGENIDEVSGAPDEYFAKPWYVRLGVVLAGPTMNYLLAFTLFSGVILGVGEPVVSTEPVIGEITAGYPAETSGLKPGDRILRVDGAAIDAWETMAAVIHGSLGRELTIVYRRGEAENTVKLSSRPAPDSAARGVIGVAPGVSYKRVPVFKGLGMGLHQCWYWSAFTVKTLASNISKREKPDLAGPIGIVNIVSKAAHTGLADLVFLIGLISVAVGFFNLLPIPLLDGGWAVLFLFEGAFKRRITPTVMKYVNGAGIGLLMSILLFATYSDLMRLKNSRDAKKAAAAAQAAPDDASPQGGAAAPDSGGR
ncbi:MAG TPA: M50 family metallopeptidase [Elusimicrobiales bacterium]|nr:M50 family metallopeptidase [Elusimicrobiales bacterium]